MYRETKYTILILILVCTSLFFQSSLGLQNYNKIISSSGNVNYEAVKLSRLPEEVFYRNTFDDTQDLYMFRKSSSTNSEDFPFPNNPNYEVSLDPNIYHSPPYACQVKVLNPHPAKYMETCKANTRIMVTDSEFKEYWVYAWHYIPSAWDNDQHGTAEVMKAHKNTFATSDGIPMHAWRLCITTSQELRISKQNFKRYAGDTDGWEDFYTGIHIPLGKWFRLGMHVRKNDVGVLNGLIEFYLGNDKIFGMNNVETYDPDANNQWCTVNAIYIRNQDVPLTCWFDDVIVSENWIPI